MLWELEAIQRSTHNIGFYEDLTKIIFELSSNIRNYALYFICWSDASADKSIKFLPCPFHGVQPMIDNFFVFLRFFFAVLLLYVT